MSNLNTELMTALLKNESLDEVFRKCLEEAWIFRCAGSAIPALRESSFRSIGHHHSVRPEIACELWRSHCSGGRSRPPKQGRQ